MVSAPTLTGQFSMTLGGQILNAPDPAALKPLNLEPQEALDPVQKALSPQALAQRSNHHLSLHVPNPKPSCLMSREAQT